MKKLIFLISIFLTSTILAAIPTMEGLFRGGKNRELAGNVIIIKLMVEEVDTNDSKEKKINYLKLYFSMEEENKIGYLQVHYPTGEMNMASATHLYFSNNLLWNLKKETSDEKIIFYSIMNMLGLNDSRAISYYLKKQSSEFKSNNQLMNKEKIKLLKKYQSYLAAKKENKDLEDPSPLTPLEDDKREKVDEILASKMYNHSGNVFLTRKENNFFWELKLATINALFDNENHFIRELKVQTLNGPLVTIFGEFAPIDGVHSLPREILIKDRNERTYKIRPLSYKGLNNPRKSMRERRKDFAKIVEEYDLSRASDVEMPKFEDNFPKTFLYL